MEFQSASSSLSGLERAVAKISRVRGPRWILWRLGQAVLKPTRLVLIENHRVWQARAESVDEIRWCARVHDCLHRFGRELDSLLAEGEHVLPDQPLPKKITQRVRKRGPQTLFALALLGGLLAAGPSAAQDHSDVVAQAKSEILARGVNLLSTPGTDDAPCGPFQVTALAAWKLRADGAGLLEKTAGVHCDWQGHGYATDVIAYPDGTIFDVIADKGQTNRPVWQPEAPVDPRRWRAPFDPGASLSPDAPPLTTPAATDLAELKALIVDLGERLTFLTEQIHALTDLEKADTATTQQQIRELRQATVDHGHSLAATLLKYLPMVGLVGLAK
jgi:hypothetical protein